MLHQSKAVCYRAAVIVENKYNIINVIHAALFLVVGYMIYVEAYKHYTPHN